MDNTAEAPLHEPDATETPLAKRPYQRPVLSKLGTLGDMTMTKSGGGAPDGRPGRDTKRGGDFETCRT